MQALVLSAFWISGGVLLYTYLIYPLGVSCWARRVRGGPRFPADGELPEITVLIGAHNAAEQIVDRVANVLACDYPPSKLCVLVASDGSTDSTVERVRSLGHPRVAVIDFSRRNGKAATLSQAMSQIRTEVVVFTDASNRFRQDALQKLCRPMANSRLGVAAGEVTILDGQERPCESLYWRVERSVRRAEGRLGLVIGASGAIYAIRRQWFVAPTRPVINDDLTLPLLVQLHHECEAVYIEEATAVAYSTGGMIAEFHRRCRIGAGVMQSLLALEGLWTWRSRRHAFAFFSHKVCRWLGPILLPIFLASNLALSGDMFFDAVLLVQLVGYAMACVGLLNPPPGVLSRASRAASSFVLMNAALLSGYWRWLRDPHNATWQPTERSLPHPSMQRETGQEGSRAA